MHYFLQVSVPLMFNIMENHFKINFSNYDFEYNEILCWWWKSPQKWYMKMNQKLLGTIKSQLKHILSQNSICMFRTCQTCNMSIFQGYQTKRNYKMSPYLHESWSNVNRPNGSPDTHNQKTKREKSEIEVLPFLL